MTDVLIGGGELGSRMRALDWARTPFGQPSSWPQSLRSAAGICLNSRFPIAIYWGPQLALLYNDAWSPIPGDKHPWALGRPGREVWPEIWGEIGPLFETVQRTGKGVWQQDQLLPMHRHGYTEECYFNFTFSPIHDESGAVAGIFNAVIETTYRVIEERRARLLRDLSERTAGVKSPEAACVAAAALLDAARVDLPFCLFYLRDGESPTLRLVASAGAPLPDHLCPDTLDADSDAAPWRAAEAMRAARSVVVDRLAQRYGAALPSGVWPELVDSAVAVPLAGLQATEPVGLLVAGVSPRRELDETYSTFIERVAAQLASAIGTALAYDAERRRAEALAAIDQAKTAFFSNVSHEFRTPLTLMLGPLEDLLARDGQLPAADYERVDVAHRNALRLLKLVNTLLDFSRMEAERLQATYEPVDLAALTAELASVFRSAVERAGLRLIVDCPPLPEPVYVDRELWEKIVLNLLSNAFKFTFAGEIAVSLRQLGPTVELTVRDTGTGIPADELPHVFERFHRVKGARGRSLEGTGIGLALVQELARLHGGEVRVASELGRGTAFTVAIPSGASHLPPDRIQADRGANSTAVRHEAFVEEALRWLPPGDLGLPISDFRLEQDEASSPQSKIENHKSKILLADDNADMRAYIARLLSDQYDVVPVGDGVAALEAARARPFDLVLTDVMMPRMDGFGLLAALRADAATQTLPVIMLSARAGEEARTGGLEAGADEYLIKPFSASELLARVRSTLALAQLRRDAEMRLRASEQRLRLASEVAGQFAWEVDVATNTITWADNAAAIMGVPADLLTPDALRSDFFIHPQDRERCRRQILEALADGSERCVMEFRTINPVSGRTGWMQAHNLIVRAAGGTPVQIYGVAQDISARKEFEAERERLYAQEREARAQAEEANRLKDEFLATVSHELRTPLTAFLGYAQLLQSRKRDEAYVVRTVERMLQSARAQAQLIEDLLDISRIVSGKLRLDLGPVDLPDVIHAALDTVRPAADAKELQVRVELDLAAGTVIGDANRLQQVVWNLLSNAVKFTLPGGDIRVALERQGRDALLIVSDTGQGIQPDFLPFVFDRFRQADGTTNRSYGGLGLGLAIVRHLVELHGGGVEATSAGEGRGATFRVRLPLAAAGPPPDDAADIAASAPMEEGCPPELDGLRVLIVDDQPDILEFLRDALTACGSDVRACSSAKEALAAMHSWRPDVLVSDIAMPEEDGYWLIRQVQALAPEQGGDLPAVALTAYVRVEDRLRVMAAGFEQYVPKPVEPDELRAVVARLARRD